VETRALAELSLELAPVDTAPRRIIGRLARHDEIVVSGPVLTQSNRLQTDDLIEIASTKSQAHLVAIGSRSLIEEAVTDVLVEMPTSIVRRRSRRATTRPPSSLPSGCATTRL
jgi:uncharacterized protein (DUF2336 family)